MKKTRRIAAFIAAMAMAATLAVPSVMMSASAAGTGVITITDASGATHNTLSAFQIFTADVDANHDLIVTGWGDGVNITDLSAAIVADTDLSTAIGALTKRYAPILFPFICAPSEKKYLVDGKEYQMKANHGFARDMEFSFLHQSENELAFELTANAETLAQYPFRFRFEIAYQLLDDGVEVKHIVENIDSKPIYFYLGGHPAFQCPIGNDGEFSDYYVEYEKPEHLTHQNGMEVTELIDGCILPMSRMLFDYDSIILPSPNSHKISLKSEKSVHSVTLEFPESNCITVWSATGDDRAKFVCLEPWTSVPTDFDNAEPELPKKEHAISLDAGKQFSYAYRIHVR